MPELVNDGDRKWIEARGFRLSFAWTGDRWQHRLEHRERGEPGRDPIAWSVEGDPARDDPSRVASPAYQQLEFQADGPKTRALLVGQSGPHHFSAVFTVEEGPHAVRVDVDVADRCRGPVEALACTYWLDARPTDLLDFQPTAAAWEVGPGRLTFSAVEPAQVALSEAGRRGTHVQALIGPDTGSPTRRCRYLWEWALVD